MIMYFVALTVYNLDTFPQGHISYCCTAGVKEFELYISLSITAAAARDI